MGLLREHVPEAAGIGALLGLAAAPLVARALERWMGRPRSGAGTRAAAALVPALLAALLASAVPAWRAARIDPNRALRTD